MMHPSVHVHPCVANGEANDEPTELLPKDLLEVSVLVFDDLLFFYCVEFVPSRTFVEKICCYMLSLFSQTSFFLFACTLSPVRADTFIEALW